MNKSWFRSLLAGLALVALLPLAPRPVAAQSFYYFFLGVVDELGAEITTGVTCRVLTADSVSTNATIYSDAALATTKTNPITASVRGQCDWYGGTATTTYDVIVTHGRGIARMQAVGVNDHRVVLNRTFPYKHATFAFSQNATETSSGIALPEGSMIQDVIIEVVTAVTGGRVSVGLLSTETGGSSGGLIQQMPASAAAFWNASPTYATGTGVITCNPQTLSASCGAGSLLFNYAVGQSTSSTGSPGYWHKTPKLIQSGGAKTLSYFTTAHAIAGYVHVLYTEIGNR